MTRDDAAACFREHKYALPFLILFLASLFLPAASHRIIFYLTVPFLVSMLWTFRAETLSAVKTKSFAFFAAYLCYFLLSFAWSDMHNADAFWKHARNAAATGIFTLSLAVLIPHIKFPPRLPVYFAAICVVFSIVSAAYVYGHLGEDMEARLRGLGRYENSIHLSFLLSYAILGLVCLGLSKNIKETSLRVGLAAGLLIFIGLSQTRSAYVSLAVCVGLMVFLGHTRFALALILIGITCSVAAYFTSDFAFAGIMDRMDSYRFEIWRDAWDGIRNKPWLGHGLATEPHFYPEAVDAKRGWKSTHNAVLGHAYTGGLLGLLIYASMVVNMIWIAVSRFRRERRGGNIPYITMFACLTLCYALCASLFNFTHFIVNVHIQWLVFWMPFAVIWHLECATNREKDPNAQAH